MSEVYGLKSAALAVYPMYKGLARLVGMDVLDAGSTLKVYVRDAGELALLDAGLAARLPDVPRLLLHARVCRRELRLEIDGAHA